jgi:hypothetical protein
LAELQAAGAATEGPHGPFLVAVMFVMRRSWGNHGHIMGIMGLIWDIMRIEFHYFFKVCFFLKGNTYIYIIGI